MLQAGLVIDTAEQSANHDNEGYLHHQCMLVAKMSEEQNLFEDSLAELEWRSRAQPIELSKENRELDNAARAGDMLAMQENNVALGECIKINGRDLVIGSTHTLDHERVGARVAEYINGSDAVRQRETRSLELAQALA